MTPISHELESPVTPGWFKVVVAAFVDCGQPDCDLLTATLAPLPVNAGHAARCLPASRLSGGNPAWHRGCYREPIPSSRKPERGAKNVTGRKRSRPVAGWSRPLSGFLILAVLAAISCGGPDGEANSQRTGAGDGLPASGAVARCIADAAREVVVRFGERLRDVSTTADDSIVAAAVREHYADLVTPELLDAWVRNPAHAPGREVSSPWPDRIEVLEVDDDDGGCEVDGQIVYVTSVEAGTGGAAAREGVELHVVRADDGRWLIAGVERQGYLPQTGASDRDAPGGNAPSSVPPLSGGGGMPVAGDGSPTDVQAAVDVIRRYYDAIAARDYRAAYLLWSDSGARSGKSLEEFSAGFARTASVDVVIGEPSRVEGAVGSRFITIPVEIRAITTSGEQQRFSGTYTLRRAVVDGATEEQRQWRITAAEIAER